MRSIAVATLLAASLATVAPALAASPMPGLTERADQSLWCATMAGELARSALANGDQRAHELLEPMASALSRQVSTFFVVLHFGEPDIRSYRDLYAAEIADVIAGTSPERYAPEECQAMAGSDLLV